MRIYPCQLPQPDAGAPVASAATVPARQRSDARAGSRSLGSAEAAVLPTSAARYWVGLTATCSPRCGEGPAYLYANPFSFSQPGSIASGEYTSELTTATAAATAGRGCWESGGDDSALMDRSAPDPWMKFWY